MAAIFDKIVIYFHETVSLKSKTEDRVDYMYVEFIKTKLCSCEIDVVQLCYYFKHCN